MIQPVGTSYRLDSAQPAFSFLHMTFQRRERSRPEFPIVDEPSLRFAERLGPQGTTMHSALYRPLHQPSSLQDANMS